MNDPNKLLSDLVAFRTYAKHLPHLGRRESLEETINRDMIMHLDKYPKLSRDIVKAFDNVHALKVMPSMRGMQFAGDAVLKNNVRQYNCSYLPIDDIRSFGEILFLLLSGTGVGYSVQKRHIDSLAKITKPYEEGTFVVHDSIIGWAQALDCLIDAYFLGRMRPVYDFSNVRAKGSYLVTTGAKAPGPEPLKYMLGEVEKRLKNAIGRKLSDIEVHDIICIISDCVLSGGIRRAALISLFDRNSETMLKSKSGEWWIKHPYRARANNSVILPRGEITKEEFKYIFDTCKNSGSGEPGFSWTENPDWGFNPCVTGDTEILTDDGYKRIDECLENSVNVWNGFEWSEVQPKVTGVNQDIVNINFSDGRSLNCTLYHKFHISTDYRGNSEIVEAKDLKPGMKLIKHDFPIIEHGPELKDAYTQGFVSAEGMELNHTIYVYKPKVMCLSRLENIKTHKWEEGNVRYRVILKETPISKSMVPIKYNIKSKLDWLAGLFDGDGTELKEGGLQLSSVNREFLADLQKLLSTVGVQSKILFGNDAGLKSLPNHKGSNSLYYCQDSYRICIGAKQMQLLKSLGMKCERLSFDKSPQRDASQFVSITEIKKNGVAETVYCFNEPKRHLGIFGGIITGQCHEISLTPSQFCNLTTINQTGITSKQEFLKRVHSATLLGTIQASYTEFPYLREKWRVNTEKEALLGISFTGIADTYGVVQEDWLTEGAKLALEMNEKYAKKIGINLAARTTTLKPEGSSSCVLGSASGIHARHSEYYLRRFRINKNDSLDNYLRNTIPNLVEDDIFSATGSVITIPQKSPKNAITRENESAFDLLNRVYMYNKHWIHAGHRSGDNKNNVSATISVKDHEWDDVFESMWSNRGLYSGISLLPYDGGNYKQSPFESCNKEKYEEYLNLTKEIDLKQINETEDNTNRTETVACANGVCEITTL